LYKDAKRKSGCLEDIPEDLKKAVVSIEDKDFINIRDLIL
jgi:membrane peptidoglycan carboxypeptidase